MRKLTSMAGNDGLMWLVLATLANSHLVQDGNDKNSGLAHSRFGLTENILAMKGMRDCIDLHLAGMLEPTFTDSPLEFIL